MYIKRAPLGQGNLAFGKRKRRYPIGFILLYLVIMAVALFIYIRMDAIQPQVLSALGPPPTATPAPSDLTAKGDEAYYEGDIEIAVEWYAQAAAIAPDDMQIQFTYSHLLTLSERYTEAVAVADQMILHSPEDARGYLARSHGLEWMGELEQAQIEALRAIELDPNSALAHAYLAEALVDLGRYGQAREQAELALTLDPYNVEGRRIYAYVLEHYGDYNGAIQQYIQALQIEPNSLNLWYGLARNYRGAGLMDKSIETYAEIGKRTPEDPNLYVEWGRTYFEMRDDDAAQSTLQQAVDLVCEQAQVEADIPEEERLSCPFLDSVELFDATEKWQDPSLDLEDRVPWDINNLEEVPPYVLIRAWNRLGQVYLTRRNYEDAVAILVEAIAWGEAQDPDEEGYQNVPIESYYVAASAYYYMDECQYAVPLTVKAFEKYEQEKMDDPNALITILRLFVLCRDWAGSEESTVLHTGPGFGEDGFPDGYEEPVVVLERDDDTSSDTEEEETEEDSNE